MFSGLISSTGTVETATPLLGGGLTLCVRCDDASDEEVEPKDSIAIDGVCLTVTRANHNVLAFDVVPETLERSTLGSLRAGDRVNVEFSLRLGDRMGGHFVYGHVDGNATVIARTPEGQGARLRIELAARLAPFICEKAFVAVDGVSVTVAQTGEGWFELALIPETLERTTLGRRGAGDRVNLEVDPFARYAVNAAALAT